MTGMLTTHVLDIMHGCPAANMQIQLWRCDHTVETGLAPTQQRQLLKTVYTTDNGRTSSPLLQGAEFTIGRYELIFAVNTYFTAFAAGVGASPTSTAPCQSPEPVFLDDIPIRFGIAHTDEHYHVPLLVSPWAYSTYRGS
jgi:5-hydroxyisourate hydrolase